MAENVPITALAESDRAEDYCGNGAAVIGLELDIFGKPVRFHIGAAQRQARLADIVPAARVLSTKLALAVSDKLRKEGMSVPCCKGCSACCNHLIPLSAPEVFRMREEVLAMPENRGRAVLQSCLNAAKKILDNISESSDLYPSTEILGPTQVSRLGRWYAGLKLPCPFLSDGLCTIYEQRPTACREHIVTGSPSLCEAEWTDESQLVRMPVSVLEALGQLASDLEGTPIEAVMLPLALPWAQENLQRHQRKWPAVMMVERFIEIVKTMAEENSAAAVR